MNVKRNEMINKQIQGIAAIVILGLTLTYGSLRAKAENKVGEEICATCAKPRGKVGSTTIEVTGGYPMLASARSLTSLYASKSTYGFGLSAGVGIRGGLQETLVDLILMPHFYTHRLFSIAGQLVGQLGGVYDDAPLLTQQGTLFTGGGSAALLFTGNVHPNLYLTLRTAFEYKSIRDLSVQYMHQEGTGFDEAQTVSVTKNPQTVGLSLELSAEVRLHKMLNLFARGGYTFRFPAQDYDYVLPQTLLSDWHASIGLSLKIAR